jgi:hypothetical protein
MSDLATDSKRNAAREGDIEGYGADTAALPARSSHQ